jgi:4-hydroxy-tetrahydrodipicolinate reductase
MGELVERLAPQQGCEIAAIADIHVPVAEAMSGAGTVDVAIDFSQGDAVIGNLTALAARKINAVIGTTGWQPREAEARALVERAGIGVVVSANFAIGMHVFTHLVEEAARKFNAVPEIGAWIHEKHHIGKKDAPSGTALMLQAAMRAAGYADAINMSSVRAGALPGTHEVGFDGVGETVVLTHEVRDRSVFAHGALEAAKWLKGRRGWFTMREVVGVTGVKSA